MLLQTQPVLREAQTEDMQKIANLVHFEAFVHRHLDYRPPLDWVGEAPFLLLEQHNTVVAALACPPDPPQVAWMRLFVATGRTAAERAWNLMWPEARRQVLERTPARRVAAIPMHDWFSHLLEQTGFEHTHSIVMLRWDVHTRPYRPLPPGLRLRPITPDDLAAVTEIDTQAFPSLWQNSHGYLTLAYQQAALGTLAELDGRPVAYQISTATPLGGHLARLAVLPAFQGRGIGYAVLDDLLAQFVLRGARTVTVNTQGNNHASLKLYHSAGFISSHESYPIYEMALTDEK